MIGGELFTCTEAEIEEKIRKHQREIKVLTEKKEEGDRKYAAGCKDGEQKEWRGWPFESYKHDWNITKQELAIEHAKRELADRRFKDLQQQLDKAHAQFLTRKAVEKAKKVAVKQTQKHEQEFQEFREREKEWELAREEREREYERMEHEQEEREREQEYDRDRARRRKRDKQRKREEIEQHESHQLNRPADASMSYDNNPYLLDYSQHMSSDGVCTVHLWQELESVVACQRCGYQVPKHNGQYHAINYTFPVPLFAVDPPQLPPHAAMFTAVTPPSPSSSASPQYHSPPPTRGFNVASPTFTSSESPRTSSAHTTVVSKVPRRQQQTA